MKLIHLRNGSLYKMAKLKIPGKCYEERNESTKETRTIS